MRGLGDLNRVNRLKKWIKQSKNEDFVICLQETKIKKEKLFFHLKVIDAEVTHIIDGPIGERVGATMSIPKHFKVLDQGTKGDGSFAWATMSTGDKTLRIGLVYVPNERRDRIRLWKWMRELGSG